jgi:hypothetical protein
VVESDRAGDVVAGAQHPGDITQGEVRARALPHRPQRLTLEVDQHPPSSGNVQHLTEVEVAVDPLGVGPIDCRGAGVHGLDRGAL